MRKNNYLHVYSKYRSVNIKAKFQVSNLIHISYIIHIMLNSSLPKDFFNYCFTFRIFSNNNGWIYEITF